MAQKNSTGWRRVVLLWLVPICRNTLLTLLITRMPMMAFWRIMVARMLRRRSASLKQRLRGAAGECREGGDQCLAAECRVK
jgi:hypothetical protein